MTGNQDATTPLSIPDLSQPLSPVRNLFTIAMTAIAFILTGFALLPILAILFEIFRRGIQNLKWETFVSLPAPAGLEDIPNGFGNAIVGTIMLVLIASIISIPLGVVTGVFLSEFKQRSPMGNTVRMVMKVLSSVPTILAGVFAYIVLVYTTKEFSSLAGGLALSVVMLPVIALTTEEALKLVPTAYRSASFALGSNRFHTIFRVVIPAAFPTIVTGILLSVARAAGETAPLIFTALYSQFWPPFFEQLATILKNPLNSETMATLASLPETFFTPTPSMTVLIFSYATSPYREQNNMAWTAGLVLVFMVLLTNILSRVIASKSQGR